jgi:hypothetical protein
MEELTEDHTGLLYPGVGLTADNHSIILMIDPDMVPDVKPRS